MTNETQALVPRPTSLPAAIERRTQITNRLLGELTRRDTEGFFRRHPEFFRLVASRYYPLDEALLDHYADRWEWLGLSGNTGLPWSEALLDRYADRWEWAQLSRNVALPWSEALIDRYADRWRWGKYGGLSDNEGLPWSEALLHRYADRWDWAQLSGSVALPWSEDLIDRYADRWQWVQLSGNAALPWSTALLDRYADRWDWAWLSRNAALPWSEVFIDRYADRWRWAQLSGNAALPWSEVFIDRYADRWDWEEFSGNERLPWSEALIERYADWWHWGWLSGNAALPWSAALIESYEDRWEWGFWWWGLSGNTGLPWSEDLIERYAGLWDWEGLSGNTGLPWSHQFYERYSERWNINSVVRHYDGNVRSLMPDQVDRLRRTAPQPFTVFRDRLRDGSEGPVMIVIPAGEFWMGSPKSEPEREDDERQHLVFIARPFAISQHAVTFTEYDRFCAATEREPPDDAGWGRADRPVIHVSYWGAVDYAEWLSEQTSRTYRLPTEAEWEYACRAGTTAPFWTGVTITTNQANYHGHYAYDFGPKGVYRDQTTPVSLFPANPWGLHDMHGNVCEWCASTYDADYTGRERHDASRDRANKGPRTLRGGSWVDQPAEVRSAYRYMCSPSTRGDSVGFRLARSF